jgi:hypothetical protein
MKGFTKGDPRASAAGRKGGRAKRSRQSADYIKGYRSGHRQGRREAQEWIASRAACKPWENVS